MGETKEKERKPVYFYRCFCGCELAVCFVKMEPLNTVECPEPECDGRATLCPMPVKKGGLG